MFFGRPDIKSSLWGRAGKTFSGRSDRKWSLWGRGGAAAAEGVAVDPRRECWSKPDMTVLRSGWSAGRRNLAEAIGVCVRVGDRTALLTAESVLAAFDTLLAAVRMSSFGPRRACWDGLAALALL
eukprot:652845-Rhodomonas_salina.3